MAWMGNMESKAAVEGEEERRSVEARAALGCLGCPIPEDKAEEDRRSVV